MNNDRFLRTLACVCSAITLSAAVFSAHAHADHGAGGAAHAGMGHAGSASASESTRAFQQGGEKMMKEMALPYTGNADNDFVARMVPHHEGAMQMAEVQLKYGKDPELRKLAREIIKAQKQEIAFMKKWRARQGVK